MSLFTTKKHWSKGGKSFKFIDLFCGLGGIRIPFSELGGECVFSSDIDKFVKITYDQNYGEIPHGDITQIKASAIPEFDILLAGFPCQPFSNAGLKKGFDDTRGTLFYDILRIINYHKPKMLLLENVKGFKNHDKGNTYKVVKQSLEKEGYKVYSKVLNAKDFGLPQNRERIYLVGILQNYESDFTFPIPTMEASKLGDILEERVSPKYTLSDKLWSGHKRRKLQHIAKGNGFGYSLFNKASKYTSTMSARYYKDGSEILIEQKNSNPRKLTPKEALRLQGFPEDYELPVSNTQAYKQCGNSVSVPVIRAIAKQMIMCFNNIKNDKSRKYKIKY